MAANSNNSNGSLSLTSILAVVGTIAIFGILVFLAYGLGGQEGEPVVTDAANQFPSAAELRAKEAEVLNSYGWVNQEAGVVRVPVDRAAELVIEELNK